MIAESYVSAATPAVILKLKRKFTKIFFNFVND